MNEMILFDFNDKLVRMNLDEQGNPWWVAKDVCDVLGISNNREVVDRLDEDEKLMSEISTSGQNRKMWFVNESGLYTLIIRSNKPEAKVFRKWVTKEVLPSIRKTGSFKIKKEDIPDYFPVTRKNSVKNKALQMYVCGNSVETISKTLSIPTSTIYRWKKEDSQNDLTNWDNIANIVDMPMVIVAKAYAYAIKKCIYDLQKNSDEIKDSKTADAITKHIAILRKIDPQALSIVGDISEMSVAG